MASEIKVNKITGKGATGGTDAPLQFSDNSISKMNLSGTAPSSPVAGDMHYDTTSNTLKIYNGTAWVSITGSTVNASTHTGGDKITTYPLGNATYRVHIFTSNGTFTATANILEADVLLVGGGGGGGGRIGGGGAGGGVLYFENITITSGSNAVVVGGGGDGKGGSGGPQGDHGQKSTFFSQEVYGGAGGGTDQQTSWTNTDTANGNGANGNGSPSNRTGGSPSSTKYINTLGGTFYGGFQGGRAHSHNGAHSAGGGAGAGEAGSVEDVLYRYGHGGDGAQVGPITDGATNYFWAGGGAGCQYNGPASPGGRGGGAGGISNGDYRPGMGGAGYNNGKNGRANTNTSNEFVGAGGGVNTGGGGSGGAHSVAAGGPGGSGIVVIRYAI
jgi:hypothetical protein